MDKRRPTRNKPAMEIEIQRLIGHTILGALPDLRRLRIAVFAEWPYLYDGDPADEEEYLREFSQAPDSVMVVARSEGRVVGAATASPMSAQNQECQAPFLSGGWDRRRLFYFGESVLLPEFRGHGIGHAFFDHREDHAQACGAEGACFAVVTRSDDHPRRPAAYVPLTAFWRKREYAPVGSLVTTFEWKDIGEDAETAKPMQFWLRRFG